MAKFLMLGRYSLEAVKGITPERTKTIVSAIESAGGSVESMYALLGCHDLAFIVDFPGVSEAMKASIAITKSSGISFSTLAATTVEDFDKAIG